MLNNLPEMLATLRTFSARILARINTKLDATAPAVAAAKLTTSRTISMTGDATWQLNFDGSANVGGVMALKNVATAGTFGSATSIPEITVDAKGRIIDVVLIPIKPQTIMPVNETITIAVDAVRQYDLQTLMGANFTSYDIKTAEIGIRVKDTNPASPLYNAYANAEAFVSYGLKDNRYVIVANQSGGPIDIYIKVIIQPLAA